MLLKRCVRRHDVYIPVRGRRYRRRISNVVMVAIVYPEMHEVNSRKAMLFLPQRFNRRSDF
jgi:hypothetical protein